MDLNFDNHLDVEPRTPTSPSTPTPTKICSRLQQLIKNVDHYSIFIRGQQLTIDVLKASAIHDTDNPYVKELLNTLYEFTDLHHQALFLELNRLAPNERRFTSLTTMAMIKDNPTDMDYTHATLPNSGNSTPFRS
ncbi:hypothetical protein TNIN_10341 [Trichonephila inaurata madagascariensis]|uniref:Uncharacterized protein n=1 Tax=Trichonephila inaurata madagascariensis TaxID=2747483 RepID=A0A8X7BUB9_9ARAC|nr:hypothetical protein TNIN_10341 [Trichonephila inaurata madagascariensis]